MIIAVMVMTFLLLLPVPFLFQLSNNNRLTEKSDKSTAAISLAEAGIERAIWELNHGDISNWEGDSDLRTMIISNFQASSENIIGDIEIRVENPEGESPVVESTGRVPYTGSLIVARTARVVLIEESRGPPPIFDYGVFGEDGVELSPNAVVDSYDSRDGDYGGLNKGEEGHTGTNAIDFGCIYLNSNAEIHGNALSGPKSNPDEVILTESNAKVYGIKLALFSLKKMPSISPPEGLPFRGSYYLDSIHRDTISESGEYTSFRLRENAKVTITADVVLYISGDFSMKSNTELEIEEDITVTIYLGGSFEQQSNTKINNLSKDPAKLVMLGTDSFDGGMEWRSNSSFWGAVYVPRAEVDFSSEADFHGSIVAKFLHLSSKAKIHFDKALAGLEVAAAGGGESSYSVKSWQEKRSQLE